MVVRVMRRGVFFFVFTIAAGILPGRADLPSLQEKEWVGDFVAYQNKRFQFVVTIEGKGRIFVMSKKGEPLGRALAVGVEFVIQETMPDGKVVSKAINPSSLESAQPATAKLTDMQLHGKVTGGAGFEVSLHEDHGVISIGGKLLEPGHLKNPLRFVIKVDIPNAYPHDKKKDAGKKEAKAFEQKTERDRLQLKWIDGKSRKQSLSDSVDAASKEINGPGIAAMSLEFSSYQEKRFEFIASADSSMTLTNSGIGALNEGFAIVWQADTTKDPDGKARLSFEVK